MNLVAAKSFLMTDRQDWRKPHLNWVAKRLYRPFTPFFQGSRDD